MSRPPAYNERQETVRAVLCAACMVVIVFCILIAADCVR